MTLKEAFARSGMTIHELARAAGMSPSTLCAYLRGNSFPGARVRDRLAEVLGVKLRTFTAHEALLYELKTGVKPIMSKRRN